MATSLEIRFHGPTCISLDSQWPAHVARARCNVDFELSGWSVITGGSNSHI